MSLVIMFYFTSSMLDMFRSLIHPSSGACDFSIESPHWSCVLVSMCVGVSVWLVWGGICVAGWSTTCACVGVSVWLGWGGIHVAGWSTTCACVGVSVWLGWGGIHVAGWSTICASACYTDSTLTQPHRNSNTHRNKNTRPMWWFNRKVAGSWWWMY